MEAIPKLQEIMAHRPRFSKLVKRQDSDLQMYYLEEYVMRDKNQEEIPNVENVTLNDARTFADRSIAILGTANRHIDCKGIEEHLQAKVENEYDGMLELNDDLLSLQMVEPLHFCFDWYSFIRGWIASRTLVYKDSGRMQPEIMPLDPRWVMWDVDRKGITWASHEFSMTPEQIAINYGVYVTARNIGVHVVEFYNREWFFVYFDDSQVPAVKIKHDIGECPIVVIPVPTEPFRLSDEGLLRQGESGYAANRKLYKKANDLASLWATMSKMQVFYPIGFLSERGRKLKQRPFGIGVVVNLRTGEKFIEIPTKDMAASAQNLFAQYLARLQRGGLPFTEYGELGFELSAVAIAKLSESRDQIFVPRLKAKARMYRRIFQLIKRQALGNGFPLTLGQDEPVYEIDTDVFKNKFTIQIEFHAISPEQNIANLNVAGVAKEFMSKHTINRDILQLKDPAKEEAMKDLEDAEDMIQELKLYNFANRLAPVKDLTEEELNEMRAMIIYWKLTQVSGGAIQAPQALQQIPGSPSLPKIDLSISPQVAMHLTNEQKRRSGVALLESGQRARQAQEAMKNE